MAETIADLQRRMDAAAAALDFEAAIARVSARGSSSA